MNDRVIEDRKAQDTVTTNLDLIPVDAAYGLLKTTHWAADLQNLRRVTLLTRDGAEFYSALGFTTGASELIYMERSGGSRA